jgi:hypothetical protein
MSEEKQNLADRLLHEDSRTNDPETLGHNGDVNMFRRSPGQRQHVANPDDPLVRHPPRGPKGVWPGPNYLGLPGRTAIVQGQVFLVAVILIVQLWLVTDALLELLSGRSGNLGWLALASLLGFALAFVISFWPRRRIEES